MSLAERGVIPAWIQGTGTLGNLGRQPKRHLADPALAARLLNVTAANLLGGSSSQSHAVGGPGSHGPLLGLLWESFVTLCMRVYAWPLACELSHLRTHRGEHEIDLVLDTPDGRVIAREVKLAEAVGDDDVRHLRWFQGLLGDRLADAIVITTGRTAYRRADGIAVIPLALLGP